jgi:polyphenol oxidase
MPGLVQAITAGADMSLFGESRVGEVLPRWLALLPATGCSTVVHARQVHGSRVLVHGELPGGIVVAGDADGHATGTPGALLAVSVADCVPILAASPGRGAVALLHGGWRGVAAGILEQGVATLRARSGAAPADLHVHFGPAICGPCFEVGPEVPAQLGLGDVAGHQPVHVDLRAHLAARALGLGVPPSQVTVSQWCTRCGGSPFYSHRGGCNERQLALIGLLPQ